MCLCVQAYMCVCMYVFMYIGMYVCMHVYIFLLMYIFSIMGLFQILPPFKTSYVFQNFASPCLRIVIFTIFTNFLRAVFYNIVSTGLGIIILLSIFLPFKVSYVLYFRIFFKDYNFYSFFYFFKAFMCCILEFCLRIIIFFALFTFYHLKLLCAVSQNF